MINVVVVNGFPRSGKDTFVNFCKKELGSFGLSVSTVDFVKHLAAQSGWDGTKTQRNRKFLSDLKNLLTEWDDIPWKKVEEVYHSIEKDCSTYHLKDSDFFLFVFSREPEEIERFRQQYGAITALIDRKEVEGEQSNDSDNEVKNYDYDFVIDNNGTLEELEEKALFFIRTVEKINEIMNLSLFNKNKKERIENDE